MDKLVCLYGAWVSREHVVGVLIRECPERTRTPSGQWWVPDTYGKVMRYRVGIEYRGGIFIPIANCTDKDKATREAAHMAKALMQGYNWPELLKPKPPLPDVGLLAAFARTIVEGDRFISPEAAIEWSTNRAIEFLKGQYDGE